MISRFPRRCVGPVKGERELTVGKVSIEICLVIGEYFSIMGRLAKRYAGDLHHAKEVEMIHKAEVTSHAKKAEVCHQKLERNL